MRNARIIEEIVEKIVESGSRAVIVVVSEYGLEDVCLSVPAIVTQEGVERIVEGDLSGEEMEALSRSASVLQEALSGLGGEG